MASADVSSLSMLRPRIKSYLRKRGVDRYALVLKRAKTPRVGRSGRVDAVVLADGIPDLLKFLRWNTRASYRFWTLSTATADVLSDLIGIPRRCVGVIDRDELFPPRPPKHDLSRSRSLVYAGRSGYGKNTLTLVKVMAELQRMRKFRSHRFYFAVQRPFRRLLEAISSQDWKRRPQVLSDLGSDWTQHPFHKPVFVSLSTYRFEDFSVSAAQAQAAGMPVVVADWFGFRDVRGEGVSKIAPDPLLRLTGSTVRVVSRRIARVLSRKSAQARSRVDGGEPRYVSGGTLEAAFGSLSRHDRDMLCYYFSDPKFIKNTRGTALVEAILSGKKMKKKTDKKSSKTAKPVPDDLLSYVYKHRPSVVTRPLPAEDGSIEILELESGDFFHIDGVAARLFVAMKPQLRAIDLLRTIDPAHVSDRALLAEARRFLRMLMDANLVVRAKAARAPR